jgi:hypothetical protein
MQKVPISQGHLEFRRRGAKTGAAAGPACAIRLRIAHRAALSILAWALHTRFVNVEDVFFLCSVVIESAAPTIRVRADDTNH